MDTYKSKKHCAEFWNVDENQIDRAVENRVLFLTHDDQILMLPGHRAMKIALESAQSTIDQVSPKKSILPKYQFIERINNLSIYEKLPAATLPFEQYVLLTPDKRFYSHHPDIESARMTAYSEGRYSVRRRHGKRAKVIPMSITPEMAVSLFELSSEHPDNAALLYVVNMIHRNINHDWISTSLPENLRYTS